MASKNTLPAKKGADAKPAKRTRRNMSRGEILVQQDHRMRRIGSVILFAVGVLLCCLTLIEGESMWNLLHKALFALFSWGAFFLGPLMLVYSVLGVSDKAAIILSNKVWQTLILVILICVTIEVFHPDTALQFANQDTLAALASSDPEAYARAKEIQALGPIEQIIQLAQDAMVLKGGGLCSALIAWPLLALFGVSGTKIIVVLGLFVFAMLMTGLTVVDVFHAFTKPVRSMESRYRETKERRRTEQQEEPAPVRAPSSARAKRVDVPLGPDDGYEEQELPQHPVRAAAPQQEDEGLFRRSKSGSDRAVSARDRLFGREPSERKRPAVQQQKRPAFDVDIGDGSDRPAEPEDTRGITTGEVITGFGADALKNAAAVRGEQDAARAASDAVPAEKPVRQPDIPPKKSAAPAPKSAPDAAVEGLISSVASRQEQPASAPRTITEAKTESDGYTSPSTALLDPPKPVNKGDITEELRSNATLLVDTLASFGVQTRIVDISRGPSVTRYELQPSAGVKISRITGLADDIALNLAAGGVRIEAPIPNKAAVGIEVPNKIVSTVQISEILECSAFTDAKSRLTVALGKDIEGHEVVADIAKMPHLLIAGATGSGKSVCINSFIVSLLYKATPDEVRLLLIDPKVVELGVYNGIPHLLIPVVTDPRKAAGALAWAVNEMLNRYKMFAENSVRDLKGYNELAEARPELNLLKMPQIVIIIDELADLMMAAPNDVEASICRLAQMARAAGMHLIIATQRPSVDVITGIIKANIPSRIAFGVASQVDSRTILDAGGAEKLLGRGDMLFSPVGATKPRRVQGCFVSDHEVERVVTFIKNQGTVDYDQQVIDDIERQAIPEKEQNTADEGVTDSDELLREAIEVVVEAGQASTSLLQRRLKVGYARAGRLIDEMEQRGIIGPFEGSKPRAVLITHQQLMEMDMNQND